MPLTRCYDASEEITQVRVDLFAVRITKKGDKQMGRQIDWYYHRPG